MAFGSPREDFCYGIDRLGSSNCVMQNAVAVAVGVGTQEQILSGFRSEVCAVAEPVTGSDDSVLARRCVDVRRGIFSASREGFATSA
jgi:hypothetical protein